MLSRTARPNESGPPEASWPSSKMMVIDLTTSVGRIGGNAAARRAAFHRSRVQPVLAAVTSPGGELHPRKWFTPSIVATLNRGAPAPQCDPTGSAVGGGFRMSYPSSLSVIPFTPFTSAPGAAKFAVGPVFTSKSPSFLPGLSFGSPPPPMALQPQSLTGADVEPLNVVALVGQPVPLSQRDLTRCVLPGSNSNGTTVIGSWSSSSGSSVQAVILGSSDKSSPSCSTLASQSVTWSAVPKRSARGPTAECGAAVAARVAPA